MRSDAQPRAAASFLRVWRDLAEKVLRHALLASANLDKLAVELWIPLASESLRLERSIEGDAVTIAFGVAQNPVAVEQERCNVQ